MERPWPGADEHGIHLLAIHTGKVRDLPEAGKDIPDVGALAFTPDGKTLIAVRNQEKSIRLLDSASGKSLLSMPMPCGIQNGKPELASTLGWRYAGWHSSDHGPRRWAHSHLGFGLGKTGTGIPGACGEDTGSRALPRWPHPGYLIPFKHRRRHHSASVGYRDRHASFPSR